MYTCYSSFLPSTTRPDWSRVSRARARDSRTATATLPAGGFAGKRATTFGPWGSGSWRASRHTFATRNGSTGRRALRGDEPFRARAFAERRPSLRSGQAFSARIPSQPHASISPRDLTCRAVGLNRVLKDRLGYYARPEGRDEPFRARAFAEPALQRTDHISTTRLQFLPTIPISP